MRNLLAPVLVLALAACGSSDGTPDTGPGGAGAQGSCHVEEDAGALVLTCPGKDPVRIEAPISCTIEDQVLQCPGQADVVIPGGSGCVVASTSPGAVVLDCAGTLVPVRFMEVGTLTGVAQLYGAEDAASITIKVVGDEALTTHPAASGAVEWKDIPAGILDLEISAEGYHTQVVRGVTLLGGSYDFGTVRLYRARLVMADATIGSQAPSGHSAIVTQNGRSGALAYETGEVQWMLGFGSAQNGSFSPGEGYFYDGISVWDFSTGAAWPFRGPVAFSWDDRLVARRPTGGSELAELRYLDLQSGQLTVEDLPVRTLIGAADGFLMGNGQAVFSVKSGAAPQKIGDFPSASLTLGPDGRLATIRNSAGVFGVDLRNPAPLPISSRPYSPYTAAFAPSGRGIALLEKNPDENSAVPLLRLWNTWSGSAFHDLGLSGQTAGVFSPDGAWLAFHRWTGKNVQMLFDMIKKTTKELSTAGSITGQRFDPRSKRLVWVQSNFNKTLEIAIWELGGSQSKPTSVGNGVDSTGSQPFVFSPDGKYLVYTEKAGGDFRLMLLDFEDPANPTELVSTPNKFDFSFTPDSKALVFGTSGVAGPLSVLTIGAAEPTQLGEASSFKMTSDGAGVLFVRATTEGSELVLWHRATGTITPVDAAPAFQILDASVVGRAFYVRAGATDGRPNGIYELPLPSAG